MRNQWSVQMSLYEKSRYSFLKRESSRLQESGVRGKRGSEAANVRRPTEKCRAPTRARAQQTVSLCHTEPRVPCWVSGSRRHHSPLVSSSLQQLRASNRPTPPSHPFILIYSSPSAAGCSVINQRQRTVAWRGRGQWAAQPCSSDQRASREVRWLGSDLWSPWAQPVSVEGELAHGHGN